MASITCSRIPPTVINRNSTPETKITPSAAFHGSGCPVAAAAGMIDSTKKKFCPIPGASAIGYRAYQPMSTLANAAAMQVAAVTAPKSMPVGVPVMAPLSTAGWTKMM